jgi:hypothetical protein
MRFGSEDDERRAGILRVAELAIAQFEAAGRDDSVDAELRSAVAKAKDDPESSASTESVRLIMVGVPELKALLTKEFPEGLRPPPFRSTVKYEGG